MRPDRHESIADDERFLRLALEEADRAFAEDEVPIGAVVVVRGEVVARAHNRCEASTDPTAHAEMVALREAFAAVGAGRLDDATLYVTLEPCAMCAGAILHARVDRVVFGAHDPKFGAAGSVVDLLTGEEQPAGRRFNHRTVVTAGVLADDAKERLRRFFRLKRGSRRRGEMPEWPIGSASKADRPARVSGVRIPLSPPSDSSRRGVRVAEGARLESV